jgi:hypothetical protein
MKRAMGSVWAVMLFGAFAVVLPPAAVAAELQAGAGATCSMSAAGVRLSTSVKPLCGMVCDTGFLMPPSGSTLASGETCSEATTNLQNVLIVSANDECQGDTGRRSCEDSLHITAPCYQYQGGTLWYVGGYLSYGCNDTSC